MGQRSDREGLRRRRRPATSPDEREAQVAGLAYELAEQQILDGTASATVIAHFLKVGSTRELLERQKIAHENELTQVKMAAMDQANRQEEQYVKALRAMSEYQGRDPETIDEG